ncbi:hypothetical protein L6452_09293 [Arctium lappa]|uniref:Uncharacterized protein n=1 Tax=Arctium lappa TaxID=4217 RepID=A0ACB9DK30_ARCLA|nr:hypothetical protein L6452_09293 [Arctium lappa]
MTTSMATNKKDRKNMFEQFSANLVASMPNVADIASLKSIDMNANDFYVIVFNMKTPSFVILDNCASNMTIEDKYGDVPTMLHMAMLNYLKTVHHPRVNSISNSVICDALVCALVGMNGDLMSQYIEFVAHRHLVALECGKLYNVQNLFDYGWS